MRTITRRTVLFAAPLACLAACSSPSEKSAEQIDADTDKSDASDGQTTTFDALSDERLRQYAQDSLLAGAEAAWASEDYRIDNVQAVYVSREYLDELESNSQENIYFGYSLSEIERQFQGTRYVFTVEDGKTTVHTFEEPDDTFNQAVRNVAIGAGVILICASVSVAAGAAAASVMGNAPVVAGALTVNHIFAISAKTAADFALGASALGGICAAITTGLVTGDVDETLKSAALGASEGFMWGAITGAVSGALSAKYELSHTVRTWKASEDYALQLYGGDAQRAFLNGEEVSRSVAGSTVPDITRKFGGHLEAIEIKNYNIADVNSLGELRHVLKREIQDRAAHLPPGSSQRVVLDVAGRGFSDDLISTVIDGLYELLSPIDQNLIIEIMR